MKTNTTIGHGILSQSDAEVFKLAAEIALYHHEQWNGQGYPHGLSGTAIPASARIVAVADVFDALSMKRPYKDAWPLERTVDYLETSAGSQLDAQFVALFLQSLPKILEIKAEWDAHERVIEGNLP